VPELGQFLGIAIAPPAAGLQPKEWASSHRIPLLRIDGTKGARISRAAAEADLIMLRELGFEPVAVYLTDMFDAPDTASNWHQIWEAVAPFIQQKAAIAPAP
jgi:hypothetical protein